MKAAKERNELEITCTVKRFIEEMEAIRARYESQIG